MVGKVALGSYKGHFFCFVVANELTVSLSTKTAAVFMCDCRLADKMQTKPHTLVKLCSKEDKG